ncbi:MAG: hypothetical protein ACHQX4_03135 [Gemmatimonadales bacterium]
MTITDRELRGRVSQDLGREFRARLKGDSMLVLFGHSALIVLVVALTWRDELGVRLASWAIVVLLTTVARVVTLRRAARQDIEDRSALAGARAGAALQALAWGLGAALLMPSMPLPDMAIVLVVLAGIGAGSLATLAPDAPSLYWFLGALGGALPFGILASAVDRPHIVVAGIVVVFTVVLLALYRRAHAALAKQLETSILLAVSQEDQARLIVELRDALGHVTTLSGLLPICSNCKKIRDDAGYWQSVEHYVSAHSDATFSHGVCPDCFPKLFGGIPHPDEERA